MAQRLYGGKEIKPLELMMNRFVMDYSVDITTAFNGLLDYIIGYFDPTGAPIEGWPFKREQNKRMYEMMFQYITIMDEQLAHKQWFDAWGDLFMALYANGADKNQFFTPPSLVNMMTEVAMNNLGEPTHDVLGFGRRHIINDPSCGSSRNLLAGFSKYVYLYDRKPYLSGEDIDSLCCKMSAVNMMMHGCLSATTPSRSLTRCGSATSSTRPCIPSQATCRASGAAPTQPTSPAHLRCSSCGGRMRRAGPRRHLRHRHRSARPRRKRERNRYNLHYSTDDYGKIL